MNNTQEHVAGSSPAPCWAALRDSLHITEDSPGDFTLRLVVGVQSFRLCHRPSKAECQWFGAQFSRAAVALLGLLTWVDIKDSDPPIGLDVLVTDGEDVNIDHQYFHYENNGRVLLPSDPRRATTTPERRFAQFVNVSHWMRLPLPPNSTNQPPRAAPTMMEPT